MTESAIKKLEEEEMRMLNQMQTTLAKKQDAIDKLKGKSKALQKNIEPRNAYKAGKGGAPERSSPDQSQANVTI